MMILIRYDAIYLFNMAIGGNDLYIYIYSIV